MTIMKNLLETLRSFNSTQPDPEYTLRSKQEIFNTSPQPARWYAFLMPTPGGFSERTGWQNTIGSPIAVMAVLVLAFFGSIGLSKIASPGSTIGSLDTQALQAEAQAVDIQIALTNVQYDEALAQEGVAPTHSAVKGPVVKAAAATSPASSTVATSTASPAVKSTPSSTAPIPSPSAAIDSALKELLQ